MCLCGKEVCLVHKEKLKALEMKLYSLNAYISGGWITMIRSPTQEDLLLLNKELAEIIKDVRKLEEHA